MKLKTLSTRITAFTLAASLLIGSTAAVFADETDEAVSMNDVTAVCEEVESEPLDETNAVSTDEPTDEVSVAENQLPPADSPVEEQGLEARRPVRRRRGRCRARRPAHVL